MKLFLIWTSGSGGDAFFFSAALVALFSAERNNLCNFGRSREAILIFFLNLDQCFRRICLLKISYLEFCHPFCSAEWNHCAILVEGIMSMRSNSVSLFQIWAAGLGGDVV